MYSYVANYSNTPHDTTGVPPSQLIFNYKPRTRLEIGEIRKRVQQNQTARAEYANERRRPQVRNQFKLGDHVQAPGGPFRQIMRQVGYYTFGTNDGYTINTRKLKLISR